MRVHGASHIHNALPHICVHVYTAGFLSSHILYSYSLVVLSTKDANTQSMIACTHVLLQPFHIL